MFIILKQAAYFARQQAQPLLLIAILLSLPGWFLDFALPNPDTPDSSAISSPQLGVGLLLVCVAVIQFAAAMIYIHQQVLGQPVSALRAIILGTSRLGPLLLINILMTLAIGLGLMLLVLPGLYMAYKLMFGEFYLLFHGQRSMQALRSSYRANNGLAEKLMPPLLIWGGIILGISIGHQWLSENQNGGLVISLIFEAATLALTLWGWAIMYRLYQLYIAPAAQSDPAAAALDEPPTEE